MGYQSGGGGGGGGGAPCRVECSPGSPSSASIVASSADMFTQLFDGGLDGLGLKALSPKTVPRAGLDQACPSAVFERKHKKLLHLQLHTKQRQTEGRHSRQPTGFKAAPDEVCNREVTTPL